MSRVILDQEILGLMDLTGKLTQARIKDCFRDDETFYFVVEKGEIGKAIGKGGANVRKMAQMVRRKVRFVEYGETAAAFVRNFIYPVKAEEIRAGEGMVEIVGGDRKVNSMLIGRDGKNLKLINKAVRRFFDVEVKVV